MTDPGWANPLDKDTEQQRLRLVALRESLRAEREVAVSPAIARALEQADTYLFLGLSCLGHTAELFPGES